MNLLKITSILSILMITSLFGCTDQQKSRHDTVRVLVELDVILDPSNQLGNLKVIKAAQDQLITDAKAKGFDLASAKLLALSPTMIVQATGPLLFFLMSSNKVIAIRAEKMRQSVNNS